MKMKLLKKVAAVALAAVVATGSVAVLPVNTYTAEASSSIDKLFAGGKGTKSNPYQIKTAKQFANIGKNATTLKKNYILVNNINFKNATLKNIGSVSGEDMMSGDMSGAFSGTFNGNGYTISNVKVKQESGEVGVGIFEFTTGTVKNVTFKNITSKGTTSSMVAGDVIGCAYGGTVSNITLKGKNTVCGVNCIGGIVGGLWGATVKNCKVTGTTVTVNGDNDFSSGVIVQCDMAECGGLVVGGGFTGLVTGCSAKGVVKATGNEPVGLGGVAGCLQCMDEISDNTANVTIYAKNGHAIGGLCGYAGVGDDGDGVIQDAATVKNCNVTVKITAEGATHVGGLIGTGLYYYGMEDRFNVVNCSVTGSIDGADAPGTVAGRAEGSTITSCETNVTVDGSLSDTQIGTTSQLYQSADQYEEGTSEAAAVLLRNLEGSYQGLFETICKDEYFDIWKKYAATVVGDANAESTAKMLQASVTGTKYGAEAVSYFAAHPDELAFDCYLQQGVATIKVEGSTISGYNANGTQIFSHEYSFYEYSEKTGMGLYSFRTDDADG